MTPLRAGSEAYVQAQIRSQQVVPPTPPPLWDPDGGVFISLIDPTGVFVITLAAMTLVSVGVYEYSYQTSTSSPLGLWLAEFKSLHGANVQLSQRIQAFNLVAT